MENTNRNAETKPMPDDYGTFVEPDPHPSETRIVNVNEAEAERLSSQLEIERDARLRLAAEYKNYRRRTQEESARASDEGKRDLLTQLLSIVDDLELALAGWSEKMGPVALGVRSIHRRILELLGSNEVVAFESVGELFDPERHEAFDLIRNDAGRPGSVHKELRRGYFWKGRLLRPALVVVEQ